MKIIIHEVNVPNVLKYKNNIGLMEDSVIKFGAGAENYLADIELDFSTNTFSIMNMFMNSKESLIMNYKNNELKLDNEDFKYIEII